MNNQSNKANKQYDFQGELEEIVQNYKKKVDEIQSSITMKKLEQKIINKYSSKRDIQ